MKHLTEEEKNQIRESLSYLHVSELKAQLEKLNLSKIGFNKNELIERLMYYITTGKELPPKKIPQISKALRGKPNLLEPKNLMLYGSYKNDLATRNFFKTLIGNHFHFTAQGIDWLRERWIQGNPPTYLEFANEWQAEYERNKKQKRLPKQEWAYIRFSQAYIQKFPSATKKEINAAWNVKRQENIDKIDKIFNIS